MYLQHKEKKDFPHWTLCAHVMTEAEAKKLSYTPFDLTKEFL